MELQVHGKSYISNVIARALSNTLNVNIAMLDMDIQNPASDIFNDISGAGNVLTQVVDSIDKKKELDETIDKYMYKDKNNKKLWYMTNNSSIFECQNKLNSSYYTKIYSSCINKYDIVVTDLPASPFIDVVYSTLSIATEIIFVINPNYISIRQTVKYLDLITKLWGISKNKISIVVNKNQKNSLDSSQILSLLSEYEIISVLDYDVNIEGYINGSNIERIENFNLTKLIKFLGISSNVRASRKGIFKLLEKGKRQV